MNAASALTRMCLAASALLSACGGMDAAFGGSGVKDSGNDEPAVFEGPVPRAVCGAGSQPETELQGQVPLEDRHSGRSQLGYSCNLELLSQYQGVGSGWQNAWYGDCDYYDTAQNTIAPGVQVIDARDPLNPKATTRLTSPAMLGPWESLKVTEQRALLGAVAAYDAAGQGPVFFDVYDVSGDCANPRQTASVPMNIPVGHEGNWAEDGKTYFGSSTLEQTIAAIDVADPSLPLLVTILQMGTHGLSTSEDGNRLYLTGSLAPGSNGLHVVDISQIQARAPLATGREIGSVTWTDGSAAQHTVPLSYRGRPFILFVDEGGEGSGFSLTGPAGAARLIDISDETQPRIVSKLKLEIHMPDQAIAQQADTAGNGLFGYQGHYCAVDRQADPTAVACGYFQSGIRVFDIRDPYQPREIAYFNPPAQVGKNSQLPGSEHAGGLSTAQPPNLTTDWCASQVRFVRTADGGGQLWGACQDNGFMILRFTNGAWPFAEG
jgi:hypothetical protein